MSGASERANGRASGPVLTSGFLTILGHSVGVVVGATANCQALQDPNGKEDHRAPEGDEDIHDVYVALFGNDQLARGMG